MFSGFSTLSMTWATCSSRTGAPLWYAMTIGLNWAASISWPAALML